jgi:hypothetical protein
LTQFLFVLLILTKNIGEKQAKNGARFEFLAVNRRKNPLAKLILRCINFCGTKKIILISAKIQPGI